MVPPGLRGAVCWTSREGGLCLHKLHTAWLRQRRIKKSLKDQQFYFSATHFSAHLNSVLPCGFSRLPSSLSLVNMVLSLFFPDLQKTLTVFFLFFFILSGWPFSQSTNPFWNFPCVDAGVQNGNISRTNSTGIFQPKEKKINFTFSKHHFYINLNNVKLMFLL